MCHIHVPSSSDAESSESYVPSAPVGKRRKLRRGHLLIKALSFNSHIDPTCGLIEKGTDSIECEYNFLPPI